MNTADSPEAQPRPCPFCGAKAFISWDGDVDSPNDWSAVCGNTLNCGASIGGMVSEDAANAAWNTRADLPRATADLEQAAQLADDFARRLRSINNHATAAGIEVLAKEIRELAPRATGETTVEACLAELREMFPEAVRVYVSDDVDYFDDVLTREVFIMVAHNTFRAPTLAAAMDQARAWAKSREK